MNQDALIRLHTLYALIRLHASYAFIRLHDLYALIRLHALFVIKIILPNGWSVLKTKKDLHDIKQLMIKLYAF